MPANLQYLLLTKGEMEDSAITTAMSPKKLGMKHDNLTLSIEGGGDPSKGMRGANSGGKVVWQRVGIPYAQIRGLVQHHSFETTL